MHQRGNSIKNICKAISYMVVMHTLQLKVLKEKKRAGWKRAYKALKIFSEVPKSTIKMSKDLAKLGQLNLIQ